MSDKGIRKQGLYLASIYEHLKAPLISMKCSQIQMKLPNEIRFDFIVIVAEMEPYISKTNMPLFRISIKPLRLMLVRET